MGMGMTCRLAPRRWTRLSPREPSSLDTEILPCCCFRASTALLSFPMDVSAENDPQTPNDTLDVMESKSDRESPYSPSDSSDSDDEDGAEDLKLQELEKELSSHYPPNYDSYLNYIRCLRKLGNIEKLREARESMNTLFPLSAALWQEWITDEISLSAGSEAFPAIERLYERGVQEYLSIPLWFDYLNFVEEHDQSVSSCTPAGISKMRGLFESALTAAGLHASEGYKIWEAYREYEQAIFLTIDENDVEEKSKQMQRIRSLFHRQLSIPSSELRSTLLAYKTWEADLGNIMDIDSDDLKGIPSHVVTSYGKALEMYAVRKQYEDQVSNQDLSDTERLQHFMTYIKFEESFGDPVRVQILYERAISEFPISSDLWLSYARYLDKALKVSVVLRSVYSRATKNCSWIGELWSRYLLLLERIGASNDEISAVFEQSLQWAFSSMDEYLDLFLTRIDGLRRRNFEAGASGSDANYATIMTIFQRAAEYLSPHMKNTVGLLRLHSYWARLALRLAQDFDAAREVWESLIKTSGSMLDVWQEYIDMEIEAGNIMESRAIYKRCYSKRFPGTGSEDICYSWVRFEREYGTLEDLDLAERKVRPRLEELALFRSQQESQVAAAPAASKMNSVRQRKIAMNVKSSVDQPALKRRKESVEKQMEGSTTLNSSAASAKHGVEEAALTEKDDGPKDTAEQPSDDNLAKELKLTYTDQCTVFISNLNLQTKEEHLHDFFRDVGGVTAIRLLRDKFTGGSRGLAYVDFCDDEHLRAAVAKNKQRLLGQKLSIARSDPKQSHKRASSGSHSARGRGKKILSGIERSAGQQIKEAVAATPATAVSHRRGGHVQLTGKNTFAMPRSLVRPLGWSQNDPKNEDKREDGPKSNEEFRNMLVKK